MMTFRQLPAPGGLFWAALRSRKPRLVPSGVRVPRLEARWTGVRLDRAHLRAYRELCGFGEGEGVPVTYPHVLVSALHLALLTSPGFPVRLLGLVHLRNRIELLTELTPATGGEVHAWLEGHLDEERMQTFDLHTEWRDGSTVCWRELTRFIAKKPAPRRSGAKPAPAERAAPTATATLAVPPGLGRRYGRVSGDVNPIHLFDLTAKLFGFQRAIIHGMWTLARCAAELKPTAPCVLDVHFKLPVFIPSTVTLERVAVPGGEDFTVVEARGEKPHLAGTLRSG